MKKMIVWLLLLAFLSGCAAAGGEAPTTDYESLNIYQTLSAQVTDTSTLEEMLTAFAAMCALDPEVETTTDLVLYEVYPFETEEGHYLQCHLARQVDDPGTQEYIQLHLDITFAAGAETEAFCETIWFDSSAAISESIQKRDSYQTLLPLSVVERNVSIGSTW